MELKGKVAVVTGAGSGIGRACAEVLAGEGVIGSFGIDFVIDPDHAERFEAQVARRGVLYTIEQAEQFVKTTADSRMHDYHWGVVPVIPSVIVDFAKALGVDTAAWEA